MQQRIIETEGASDGSAPDTQERVWWMATSPSRLEETRSSVSPARSKDLEQRSAPEPVPYYPGEYNSWVCLGDSPCPLCLENEAAGPVRAGEPFPSGDIAPPAHPHCQCDLIPAEAPEQPKPIVPAPPRNDDGGGPGALEVPV